MKIPNDIKAVIFDVDGLLIDSEPSKISLMEGAKELIAQLQQKHIPMAVATNGHSSEKIKKILDTLTVGDAFQVIISADQVAKGKPAPDVFLEAASSLRIDPSQCLVFEDAPSGVQAGKAAGMTVYGVNKEEWWRRELQASGADKIFASLTEIII